MENRWRDLKQNFLAHQTFDTPEALDAEFHRAITDMNQDRENQMFT